MCNSLQHPSKTQIALSAALRLRTTSEIVQNLKLILSENVVEPSIYTALLSTFPPQSEKNFGVKYVYQKKWWILGKVNEAVPSGPLDFRDPPQRYRM